MTTVDRDKSTMMALHELRAIEQRRIAEEAAAERARREAEERQAEARRAREQAERETRERAEREERERIDREQGREQGELQVKAERVARLEVELEELSQRMAELQEGLGPASEPLAVPPAAPASRLWTWGFAAVSWLGALTLIAILWHVAQRPPVVPRFVVPDLDPALFGNPPGAGKAGPIPTAGSTTAPGDRAPGGPTHSIRNASVSGQEGTPRGPHAGRPPVTARNNTRGVTAKPSLEACSHSEDPLACINLDDQPLGAAPRPKPRVR